MKRPLAMCIDIEGRIIVVGDNVGTDGIISGPVSVPVSVSHSYSYSYSYSDSDSDSDSEITTPRNIWNHRVIVHSMYHHQNNKTADLVYGIHSVVVLTDLCYQQSN